MIGSSPVPGIAVLGGLLALAATAVLVVPASMLARGTGFVARPRVDRAHSIPTPLLGGAACILGIATSLTVVLRELADNDGFFAALAAGVLLLLILGLVDDRMSFRPAVKAAFQTVPILAFWLLWRPAGALGPGAGAWTLVAPVAVFVLVNGWNYIDHADGIFAVNAGVAGLFLAFLSSEAGDASGHIVAVCATGSLAGFLLHNRPRARIFLGDGGSLPLGFLLAALALRLVDSAGPRIGSASAASQLPALLEIALVTGVRIAGGAPLFRGGVDHSGHRFALRLGPGRALAASGASAAVMMLAPWFAGAWLPGAAGPAAVGIAAAAGVLMVLLRLPAPS